MSIFVNFVTVFTFLTPCFPVTNGQYLCTVHPLLTCDARTVMDYDTVPLEPEKKEPKPASESPILFPAQFAAPGYQP